MRSLLFPVLLGCSPLLDSPARSQDPPPPPPPPAQPASGDSAEDQPGGAEARLNEESVRFSRDMEEKMRDAMARAAALEAEGKKGEADELRAQAKRRMQAAVAEHQQATQARMKEQRQRQRADRIERTERERERQRVERANNNRPDPARQNRPPGEPPSPEIQRKLHHVEQAIGHLREAGLADAAENLERLAQRLRQAGDGDRDSHPQAGPPADRPRRGEGVPPGPRRGIGRPDDSRPQPGRPDAPPPPHAGPPPPAGHPGFQPPHGPGPDDALADLRREVEELKRALHDLERRGGPDGKPDGAPDATHEKHH